MSNTVDLLHAVSRLAMDRIETYVMPVISTAHLTDATRERMCRDFGCVFSRDEGWLLHVPAADAEPLDTLPADVAALHDWCRARSVVYVMLDCDADAVDDMPTYD